MQPDGKILLAGYNSANPPRQFLARLNPNGTPDPTFAGAGFLLLGSDSAPGPSVNGLSLQADGKLLAAGNSFNASVVRFLTDNGSPPASISGTVFDDSNHNGVRDFGETGLAGVTVYLDLNGNGRLDPGENRTVTDAGGYFTFADLPAGSYIVRQVSPPGFAPTAPLGYASTMSLSPGQPARGTDFGDVRISSVKLDFSYLVTLAAHYQRSGTFADGDLNGDGQVDLSDLEILAANYGHPLTSASGAALSPDHVSRLINTKKRAVRPLSAIRRRERNNASARI